MIGRVLKVVGLVILVTLTVVVQDATASWVTTGSTLPHAIVTKRVQSARFATQPQATTTPTTPTTTTTRRQWVKDSAAIMTSAAWICPQPAAAAMVATTATRITEARTKTTAATCDPSVSVWKNPESKRKIYILGTAHISDSSAQLAGTLIDDVRPDAVFLELDAKRVNRVATTTSTTTKSPLPTRTAGGREGGFAISDGQSTSIENGPTSSVATDSKPITPAKGINPFDFKQRFLVAGSAAVGTAIQGMYKNLNKSGFNAGEEFIVAIRQGQKVGATIVLGDRDVEVTLQRLTQALAKTNFATLLQPDSELEKTMNTIMPSQPIPNSENEKFKEEMTVYVETMKAKENVKLLMTQLKRAAPELYEALVAERDAYMANGLDKLDVFPTIVAVMGIAHVDGVESTLKSRGWVPVPLTCPNMSRR